MCWRHNSLCCRWGNLGLGVLEELLVVVEHLCDVTFEVERILVLAAAKLEHDLREVDWILYFRIKLLQQSKQHDVT